MRKYVLRGAAVLMAIMVSFAIFSSFAVTDKEMEQARAITAQAYLRYANDGSGYLDDLKPATTVAELEKNLKTKEKENIKAFKAVSTPKDYASWDKEKLVEYWSVTFFKSPGLLEKGTAARGRVKKKVSAMTVSASAPVSPKAETPAPASGESTPAAAETAAPAEPIADAAAALAEEIPAAESIISAAEDSAVVNIDDLPHERKSNSGMTWVYVVALLVLVGVVIWLVIFASKTMQSGNDTQCRENGGDDDDSQVIAATSIAVDEDIEEMPAKRERHMETPVAKGKDVSSMEREIHDLRNECLRLGEENGRLTSDLNEARRELEALRGRLKAANAVTSAASATPMRQHQDRIGDVAPKQQEREIFLGRVNGKGLFVRADKIPVADKSVYVLVTQDGYTGSFRVIQSTEVVTMALDNPEYYLAGGCVGPDLANADDAEGIKTLSAGTAIFESGCWRVLRKSKIAYV